MHFSFIRYRRREYPVEEALIEMYLAEVSVRRVEDITEALWEPRFRLGGLVISTKKLMNKLKIGETVHYKMVHIV